MRQCAKPLFLLLCLPVLAACAEEALTTATQPGEYLGRTIAPVMGYGGAPWLLRDERDREEDTDQLLAAMQLEPGQVICDFGSGNGYHTLRFAPKVLPGGKVYAVDIQPAMLDELNARAEEADIENVETILAEEDDAKLPDATFDRVFMCDVYHELADPEGVLAQVKRSLKPGGLLVLVEFRLEDPDVPIKLLHKMSKAQIDKELTANGFALERSFDGLPWQHLVFYGVAAEEGEGVEEED